MKKISKSKHIKEIIMQNNSLEGFWIEDGVLAEYKLSSKRTNRGKFRIYKSRRCFDIRIEDWLECNDISEDLLIKYLIKMKATLVESVEEAKKILGIVTI
ncbi:MAG: hypothetical protein ACTSO9_04675 [Candidatus Helarchaeota archaeon]